MVEEDRKQINFTVEYSKFPRGGPPCPACGEGSLVFCPGCHSYHCLNSRCKARSKVFSVNEVALQKPLEAQRKL